jgi:hypothetical protein
VKTVNVYFGVGGFFLLFNYITIIRYAWFENKTNMMVILSRTLDTIYAIGRFDDKRLHSFSPWYIKLMHHWFFKCMAETLDKRAETIYVIIIFLNKSNDVQLNIWDKGKMSILMQLLCNSFFIGSRLSSNRPMALLPVSLDCQYFTVCLIRYSQTFILE